MYEFSSVRLSRHHTGQGTECKKVASYQRGDRDQFTKCLEECDHKYKILGRLFSKKTVLGYYLLKDD